jgi:hypothetical protein
MVAEVPKKETAPAMPGRQRHHLLDMRHAVGAEARQQTATVLRTCLQTRRTINSK